MKSIWKFRSWSFSKSAASSCMEPPDTAGTKAFSSSKAFPSSSIATTTATVCGFAMLELFKVLQKKPLDKLKDSSNNLGINLYCMQEPMPPEKAKDEYDPIEMSEVVCKPPGFTKWDKYIVDSGGKDLTLKGFLDAFKEVTGGLTCVLLYHSVTELDVKGNVSRGKFLYDANAFTANLKDLYQSKMDTSLKDWVAERYSGAPMDVMLPTRRYVELQASSIDDEEKVYKLPTVVYKWA